MRGGRPRGTSERSISFRVLHFVSHAPLTPCCHSRPMAAHLKAEREELVLRAALGLKQYDRVISEGSSSSNPALRALALHAAYLSSAPEARPGVVDSLKALMAGPDAASNTSLQLVACHIYLAADMLREALQCVHHGLTMEHLAMCVQIYIRIDRLDLAKQTLDLLRQADEDSILAQLTSAYVGISGGRSGAEDAVHLLGGLSEQYGPSLMLLNVVASANIVGARYDAAEANLREAVDEFGGAEDADTLVNLVVVMQHLGRKRGDMEKYISVLKSRCSDHPYVRGLIQVEGALEREGGKYATASA